MSKSDLVQWLHCPYAFSLIDTGQVPRADAMTPLQRQLAADGVAFETAFEAPMPTVAVTRRELPRFLEEHGDATLFRPPLLENPRLRLFGTPDGIEIADGALYPVEEKSHKHARHSDLVELAFYWRLLEPLRTRRVAPRGILVLRRNGRAEVITVELPPRCFGELDIHLAEIRRARREGVRPRFCRCGVCTGRLREEIREAVEAARDLTMISGVSRPRALVLEQHCAIASLDDLARCEPEEIVRAFRTLGDKTVGNATVHRWRLHALAYQQRRPAMLTPAAPFPIGPDYLAVDLEYDPESSFVWLVGVCVVRDGFRHYEQRWAEDAASELANLRWLGQLVEQETELQVITWSGKSADLPTLQKASQRLSMDVELIRSRAVDPYTDWMLGNLRLPLPSMTLTDVAAYFGVRRTSAISGGFEAMTLYRQAVSTDDVRLRERLLEYNRDDLEGLIAAVEGLRSIAAGANVALLDRAA